MAATATQNPFPASHFSAPTISPAQQYDASTVVSTAEKSYQSRNVQGIVNYLKENEDGSPPAPSYVGRPETFTRPANPVQVTVHDLRGHEENFSLNKTGFEIFKHKSEETEFADDEHIKSVYYPEIVEILKKANPGAHRVFIFDHTIRRAPSDNRTPAAQLRGPVQRVHIDQSYAAGPSRVTHHMGEDAAALLEGRYQIINAWRPIRTIRKDPLAVADANSVSDDDLVPVKLIYPDREGETCSVKKWKEGDNGHKWYYLNEQTPEEVLLIKCFDSKSDGRARRVPHTSFIDEEREGDEARQSIEVRALVFGGN